MSAFADLDAIGPIGIWNGVLARTVEGEQCSFGVVELEPDSVVREHQHPNEQLGIVVSGSVRFRIGDEERELAARRHVAHPAERPARGDDRARGRSRARRLRAATGGLGSARALAADRGSLALVARRAG